MKLDPFFPFSEIRLLRLCVCVCVVCVEFHVIVATPSMEIGGTTTIDGASSHPRIGLQIILAPFIQNRSNAFIFL